MKKKSKAQKKKDAAFIKKLQSLTFGFGAAPGCPKPKVEFIPPHLEDIKTHCPGCGIDMELKHLGTLKATIAIDGPVPFEKPKNRPSEEQSFCE